MGNKYRTWKERTATDPRTKRRRKKRVYTSSSCSSSTTTTADNMESTSNSPSNSLVDVTLSSSSSAISNVLETSSPPGLSLDSTPTASERKIKESTEGEDIFYVDDLDDGHKPAYILMDTEIMFSIFDELVKCPRCGFHVETRHLIDNKQGLAHNFQIKSSSLSCQWSKSFFSSKEVTRDGRGSKPFDVNLRKTLAFREIGKGHAGIETFCGCMNMPPPMTELTYNNTIKTTMHPTCVGADGINVAIETLQIVLMLT